MLLVGGQNVLGGVGMVGGCCVYAPLNLKNCHYV